jgi:7-cyano-7-deazaguanine synthase
VLLSGGIDSSTCLAFFLSQGMSAQGIFVDYGQASAKREARAARVIAAHYGVPLIRLAWSGCTEKGGGLIRARNAFLVMGALMELPEQVSQLALGIHAGTPYVDCRPSFLSAIQAVIDQYELGSVRVAAPFVRWTKSDIWQLSKQLKVPTNLTYSCELGLVQPCGRCDSCADVEALIASPTE